MGISLAATIVKRDGELKAEPAMRFKLRRKDGTVIGYIKVPDDVVVPSIGENIDYDGKTYTVEATSMKAPKMIQLMVTERPSSFLQKLLRRR